MQNHKPHVIALFPNVEKKQWKSLATEVGKFLTDKGIVVVARDEEAKEIDACPLSTIDPTKLDFLISMGGDGTILRLIHAMPHLQAPVVGINLGGLGFMADIPLSEIYPSLEELINGAYIVENRLMIDGEISESKKSFAGNDIVLHRASNTSLVSLAIHVGDIYLNTFAADGVVISTPNGSTAYSLAAGGPILTPELNALVITPICAHTISNRPVVLTADKEIRIECISKNKPIEVTFDGVDSFSLKTGESIRIKKCERPFQFVSLDRNDYFTTLRTKLNWAGRLRQD